MTVIKNAEITETFLGFEDHGILTIDIGIGYGEGTTQMFGGYALGGNKGEGKYLQHWVVGLLKTVGVDTWEKLKGKHIRVEKEDEYGKVLRIGNFLKDEWFDPKETL